MLLNAFRRLFSNSQNRKARRASGSPRLELLSLEGRIVPATFTVSITGDSGAGSLRQAIIDANNESLNPGADTIVFAASLTASAAATINLSTSGDGTAGPSAFSITSAITITGPTGSNGITLNNTFVNQRLFYVSAAGNLTLDSLTLSGGKAQGGNGASGGGGAAGLGGAVFNAGSLTLRNSTLSGNQAIGGNGGIYITTSSGYGGGGGGGGNGGQGTSQTTGNGGGPNGGVGGPPPPTAAMAAMAVTAVAVPAASAPTAAMEASVAAAVPAASAVAVAVAISAASAASAAATARPVVLVAAAPVWAVPSSTM